MEWVIIAIVAIVLLGLPGAIRQGREKKRAEQARREHILTEHADFADDILANRIRVGMTVEELLEAWGQPAAIDERVLKTKVVHTYKYAPTSHRRFRQRVKVENGIVVGWTNT